MRIYITGATGFVGKNLVPRLLEDGHDLTCLMRYPDKYRGHEIFKECNIVKGDITERESLRDTMRDIDICIHLAVATPQNVDRKNFSRFYITNVIGTRNVLDECVCSKPGRIIYFSSTAAIGIQKEEIIDESTPLNPLNNYGRSKKEADDIIFSYIEKENLPILTICFPHIYGPGDRSEFLKIVKMLKKGIFPQVGFAPNLLPSVYVEDAIDAIILACTKGRTGEKYLIADDDPHDLREIRRLVLKNLGINRRIYPFVPRYIAVLGASLLEVGFNVFGLEPPVKVENIKSIISGRRLSINKARRDLGFEPKIGLDEGIKWTIEWYRKENLI